MPFERGYGGGMLMDAPEISSDRKTFAFLAGIAALGLSLAVGVNFAIAKLAPPHAPLPIWIDLRSGPERRHRELSGCREGDTRRLHRRDAAGHADGHQLRRLPEAAGPGRPVAGVDPTDAHSAYGNCPLLFLLRQAREPATYLAPLSQLARTVAERLDAGTLDDGLRPFAISDRPGGKPTGTASSSMRIGCGSPRPTGSGR